MLPDFPRDPAGLRFYAEFLQRLALTAATTPIREELETLSFRSMEEAMVLEKDPALQLMPNEMSPADTRARKLLSPVTEREFE